MPIPPTSTASGGRISAGSPAAEISRRTTPRSRTWRSIPELVFLNRFDAVVPLLFAFAILGFGRFLEVHAPGLHTTGWQMLVWGFFISTTALFHGTSCINSMAHLMGKRRYKTEDDSRNSFILAIITLGEGWHNNHHRYMSATRNGFYWWEIDITYYVPEGAFPGPASSGASSPCPKSVLEEGAHADHHASVAAAAAAAQIHPEYSSLAQVVPAAAAIAVATVNAAHPMAIKKPQAAMHKDLSEQVSEKPTPPAESR